MHTAQSNILLLGILLLSGLFAGQFANRIGIPRVAAYVLIGTLFSSDLLGQFLPAYPSDWAQPLTHVALSIIAFIIGGSITAAQLQRMGKSIIGIALGESFGAMLAVFFGLVLLSPQLDSVSLITIALVFSAISATTAPASTIAVLHQYHAKGPLSTTLLGVVALDDALGIIFFSVVMAFLSGESVEYNIELALTGIATALILGIFSGWLLAKLAVYVHKKSMLLPLTLGTILTVSSLAGLFQLSALLTTMTLGFSARHFLYSAGDKLFGSIDFMEETVFLLFFTLAGTHFHINVFVQHIDLILVYFFARILGKILGSACGAKITKSPLLVTRWLGLALIPQAGVAVGLALTLSHHAEFKDISVIIMNVILATTLIYELIGPLAARFSLYKAGELQPAKKQKKTRE